MDEADVRRKLAVMYASRPTLLGTISVGPCLLGAMCANLLACKQSVPSVVFWWGFETFSMVCVYVSQVRQRDRRGRGHPAPQFAAGPGAQVVHEEGDVRVCGWRKS